MAFLNYFNFLFISRSLKISAEKVFLLLLEFTVFWVPLSFLPFFVLPAFTTKVFSLSFLVTFALSFWIFLLFVRPEYRLRKEILLFFSPVFIFTFWLVISGIFGVDIRNSFWSSILRGTGVITFCFLLAFSLMVTSAVQVKGKEFITRLFLWSVSAGAIATFSIWIDFPNVSGKGGGLIGNSSFAGAYMVFNIFFSAFLLYVSGLKEIFRKLIILALIFMITSPLFLNVPGIWGEEGVIGQARGAVVGVLSGFLLSFFVWLFFSSNFLQKVSGFLGSLGLAVSSVFVWFLLITPGNFINQEFTEHTGGNRLVVWEISKEAFLEKPILGWGPENFSYAFNRYFHSGLPISETNFDRAHNIFWDLAVSGGAVLVIFYLGILAILLWLLKLLYKKKIFTRDQISIFCGLIFAYIIQNLFVFDMVPSLLAWYLFIGVVFGAFALAVKLIKTNKAPLLQSGFSYGLFFIFLCSAVFTVLLFTVVLPAFKAFWINEMLKLI